MTPKISVIIAVYNTGPYLGRCLDSVTKQTLRDIEIICVDDGSTDDSLEILKKCRLNDQRINIIEHPQNKGQAAARNTGMRAASGEYLYFIDSDDWIDLDYLEILVGTAECKNVDVVMNTNIIREFGNGKSERSITDNFAEHIGLNRTGPISFKNHIGNFTYSSCCCIYKRSFITGINAYFPEGFDFNDNFFHIAALINLDSLYLINYPSYHYFMRHDSICGRASLSLSSYDIIYIYEMIYDYYIKNNFIDRCKLNFFELSYYIPLFADKDEAVTKINELFNKMFHDVSKRRYLYRPKELNFFDAIVISKTYNDFINKHEEYKKAYERRKTMAAKLRRGLHKVGTLLEDISSPVTIKDQVFCQHQAHGDMVFSKKKIALLAHWDPHGLVDPYVVRYLVALKDIGYATVLISTRAVRLSGDALAAADAVLWRGCSGYDFTSWKAAFEYYPALFEAREILLTNDSVFGPMHPLSTVHDTMDKLSCDFWGLTFNKGRVPHLQSYYLAFRSSALKSGAFKDFFNAVDTVEDKYKVVTRYEMGLTVWLQRNGLKAGAYIAPLANSPSGLRGKSPIHKLWRQFLGDLHVPFLKRNLVRDEKFRSTNKNWEEIVAKTDYPISLIQDYLQRTRSFFNK